MKKIFSGIQAGYRAFMEYCKKLVKMGKKK